MSNLPTTATLPDIDELSADLGNRARWAFHGSHGVHVLAAQVGDTLVACNPGVPAEEPPVLLIDTPKEGPRWFRVHDDDVQQAAQLVVAALLNVASPTVAEEAAKSVPFRRVRLAVELVRAAIKEARPATRDFPELRALLPAWE